MLLFVQINLKAPANYKYLNCFTQSQLAHRLSDVIEPINSASVTFCSANTFASVSATFVCEILKYWKYFNQINANGKIAKL